MNDIKLLYHTPGRYQIYIHDVAALVRLCERTGFHLADNDPQPPNYRTVTPDEARTMWNDIVALRSSNDDISDRHINRVWRAVYIRDAQNTLAGVTAVRWRYRDSGNAIQWEIECGLQWTPTPLPAAALKLIAAVQP